LDGLIRIKYLYDELEDDGGGGGGSNTEMGEHDDTSFSVRLGVE
jgi:hypothetical protein